MTDRDTRPQPPKEQGADPKPEPQAASGGGSFPLGFLRWLISGRVRQATAMRKHVQKILNHQRDILSPAAVQAVETALAECQRVVASNTDKAALDEQMASLEKVAGKWLKPYPNAAWRENIEVLLVALGVAMGIRTFFLQPFKIPTGSMQPTLFGVTSVNLLQEDPDFRIPTGLTRIREWFEGTSYLHVVARNDGELRAVQPPVRFLIFNIKQTLWIGNEPYTIWFPPDYGAPPRGTLEARAGLRLGESYTNGQDIIKLKVDAGDHLFVDRLSYNFTVPKRGEIIVFETRGIDMLPQDQFYIKRLVGLGGERIQLGDDRHLRINGERLTASTPHFENVYSFDPKDDPMPSRYSGHVNRPMLAPLFQDKPDGLLIPPNYYMVMGDNTMDSYDSRAWGYFPSTNVIGKSFFVYWPLTKRFGWGTR
jgi:signal peptidase I